tara:strand:- start:1510 stop:2310 length:801 start_codon:yes stop_codon:yes gene_type:complete
MNLDLISSKLEKLQAPQGQKSDQKFDRSQYFWKAPMGKSQIRFVPFKENKDNPFSEVFFHYGIGTRTMISPINYGEKDPIVEFSKELRKTSEPENWRLAKKLEPKMRVFAPVVVRGEENRGVRFWEFGKQVYQELLSYAADEDYGDFTDVVSGLDMTVEVVQGNPYPQTSLRVKPKQSPLSDDNTSVEKWLAEQPELLKYYKKYSYDEMKTALQEWLNPEETSDEGSILDGPATDFGNKSKDTGYTLNVKTKETVSDNDFDDLFKD